MNYISSQYIQLKYWHCSKKADIKLLFLTKSFVFLSSNEQKLNTEQIVSAYFFDRQTHVQEKSLDGARVARFF
jgi:hypothetical protein